MDKSYELSLWSRKTSSNCKHYKFSLVLHRAVFRLVRAALVAIQIDLSVRRREGKSTGPQDENINSKVWYMLLVNIFSFYCCRARMTNLQGEQDQKNRMECPYLGRDVT